VKIVKKNPEKRAENATFLLYMEGREGGDESSRLAAATLP
jgi:hypothetical protein